MNMPVPVAGVDPGFQWALDINSCLSILDGHDHTPGYGVPITPGGLNISSDLPFINNNAIDLKSVRFTSQVSVLGAASDLGCLYVVADDLYYNDESGNQIQITQGGGIAGSPGSISNLTSPASAAYVSLSSTFVWQSGANTPANMDFASAVFRNLTAGSFGLTLNPPAAMGANYTLTLPSLPASQKIMSLDASGNITAPYTVDGSSLSITSNVIGITVGGVGTTQLGTSSVTRPKMAPIGEQISSSSGSYANSTTSYMDVTNLTGVITTNGRLVFIGLMPDGSGVGNFGVFPTTTSSTVGGFLRILRDATTVYETFLETRVDSVTGTQLFIPPGSVWTYDLPPAGNYAYKVQVKAFAGSTVSLSASKLIVFEEA